MMEGVLTNPVSVKSQLTGVLVLSPWFACPVINGGSSMTAPSLSVPYRALTVWQTQCSRKPVYSSDDIIHRQAILS